MSKSLNPVVLLGPILVQTVCNAYLKATLAVKLSRDIFRKYSVSPQTVWIIFSQMFHFSAILRNSTFNLTFVVLAQYYIVDACSFLLILW